jgi:co-chaperonin GroES (HSP10)
LNDRVLVLKDVVAGEATTATGIIVPDSAKSALNTGTVIEVAEDVKVIKKGDKVLFNPYANL